MEEQHKRGESNSSVLIPLLSSNPITNEPFQGSKQSKYASVTELIEGKEMSAFFERLKKLFSEKEYRVNLLVFLLMGIIFILSSILAKDSLWEDIMRDIAITFITVAFVQVLWSILGGDPVELQIQATEKSLDQEVQNSQAKLEGSIANLNQNVDSIKDTLYLSTDLIESNSGIERIWPDRRKWQDDKQTGLNTWKEWIYQAKEITIISNTLFNNWMGHDAFRTQLLTNLIHGATINIVVYHPTSPLLIMRAKDEKDPKNFGVYHMQSEILSTLSHLVKIMEHADANARKRLRVGLMHDYMLFSQIIRADERMLVALYLSGRTGSPSPTIQIKGAQTAFFKKYLNQTEIYWDRTVKVDLDQLKELINKSQNPTNPSPEV